MYKENKLLNKLLDLGRKIIPKPVFKFAQPKYHWMLSMIGAIVYGFPSKSMAVIGVTGTKGKSTVVHMVSKILEDQGQSVAAIGSLGFKIKDKTWPNTLKMTLPGRFKLQNFLSRAKRAGIEYVVLEATSEGIAQNRLVGIDLDCAVFTNLHREHLESHGSFENYMNAKRKLFAKTKGRHVLNIDDSNFEKFANYQARHKITYGLEWGMLTPTNLRAKREDLNLKIIGDFNIRNALAALGVAYAYNLNMDEAVASLNAIESIPGRMEVFESKKDFKVIVDYAHTPDSLEAVYKNLKPDAKKLICVLGAAGGGRDKWKRPEFGKIASNYCDNIILTNEDPFDEDPNEILDQVESGVADSAKHERIVDRDEAIKKAISKAEAGDIVIITGKGSETSIALRGGQKKEWSDKNEVLKNLQD
ncbi:MAG: UDP-N-acetylmuramoyl-L-alanyl-D-glutamate--2,6-diaminopimelate ligase [Candidatus Paceibacterota bacterium]